MAGLLDFFETPAGQGLLAAGLGMAANAGRGGTFNTIGRGGLLGLAGFSQAQDAERRAAEDAQQREFRELQMNATRANLAADQRKQDFLANMPSPGFAAGQTALADGGGPTVANAATAGLLAPFNQTLFEGVKAGAVPLTEYLKTIRPKQIEFSKIDPKDYTQQSLAEATRSGDYTKLVPVRKMEVAGNGQVFDPFNVQAGAVFADPNKPFAVGQNGPVANEAFQNFELRRSKASAPSVNVNTDKSYFGHVAEGLAKNDVAAIDAARSAPERIQSARRVKGILAQNPITGTAAEARLAFNKAFATAGLIDGKTVADTETLASNLASQTLDAIKTSGLGSGQGFTDKDRQFLERAKSGNIEMTGASLHRLAELNERSAVASIERGNAVITKLRSSPQAGAMGRQLDPVEIPAPPSVVRKPDAPRGPAGGPRFLGFE